MALQFLFKHVSRNFCHGGGGGGDGGFKPNFQLTALTTS